MDLLKLAVQLTAATMGIASMWFYARKHILGPAIGAASQVPWWMVTFMDHQWGLLPVNVTMACIHTYAVWKWAKGDN